PVFASRKKSKLESRIKAWADSRSALTACLLVTMRRSCNTNHRQNVEGTVDCLPFLIFLAQLFDPFSHRRAGVFYAERLKVWVSFQQGAFIFSGPIVFAC